MKPRNEAIQELNQGGYIIHNNTQKVKGEYTKLRNILMPLALSLGRFYVLGKSSSCIRRI